MDDSIKKEPETASEEISEQSLEGVSGGKQNTKSNDKKIIPYYCPRCQCMHLFVSYDDGVSAHCGVCGYYVSHITNC